MKLQESLDIINQVTEFLEVCNEMKAYLQENQISNDETDIVFQGIEVTMKQTIISALQASNEETQPSKKKRKVKNKKKVNSIDDK